MFELGAQRGGVLHPVGGAKPERARARARVHVEQHLGGPGTVLDRGLQLLDRAISDAAGIDAQVKRPREGDRGLTLRPRLCPRPRDLLR